MRYVRSKWVFLVLGLVFVVPAVVILSLRKPELSEARLAELAKVEIPGFKRIRGRSNESSVVLSYESEKPNSHGVKLIASVTIEHCWKCRPMDVDAWRASDDMKGLLAEVKMNHPDPALVFDIHSIDLGRYRGVGLYTEGFYEGFGFTRYNAWWNNDVNEIGIGVMPELRFHPKSREEMRDSMPRNEMDAAVKAIYAAFGGDF